MKLLKTTLLIFILLIGAINAFAEGTWTTFSKRNHITSIAVVSDVEVWFSNPGSGVWRYDGETWTSFTYEGGFSTNYVFSIAGSSESDVWFGTRNGVSRYDGKTWTTFDKGDDLPDGEGPIDSIAITPGGMVWVSLPDVGVSRYDGETWTTFTTDDGLISSFVTSIAVLSDDIVLFGTDKSGISIYNRGNWTNIDINDGLIDNMITSIAIAQDGVIWAGANGGVSKYDGEMWISYTTADGLGSDMVTSIATGSDGLVWVGTNEGLSCYNGKTWTTFTTDDGLAHNDIESLAVCPDNTVWVGTYEGLSSYIPDTGASEEDPDVMDLPYVPGPIVIDTDRKQIAVITSLYQQFSHADVIAGRLLEGYGYNGENRIPRLQIISMYVDQIDKSSMVRDLSDQNGFSIYPSIRETLFNGRR